MAKKATSKAPTKTSKKKTNRKIDAEEEGAIAVEETDEEEEIEIDDGIDDDDIEEAADEEEYEDADEEEEEDDEEEEEEEKPAAKKKTGKKSASKPAPQPEDDDEEEEAEEEVDSDDGEESEDDGEESEDDGEEAAWSEGFEVIDYAPDELTAMIERDPESPKVKEIAKSIRTNGLINPLVITSDAFILAGNRRYAACKRLGMKKIPCRIAINKKGEQLSSSDLESSIQAVADNVNRATMTPLEQGREFASLIEKKVVEDAGEISRLFGIPAKTVQKYINLATDATDALIEALESDKITAEAAITIQRRSKSGEELDELLSNLIDASNGKKISVQVAKEVAQKEGKTKKSTRGRKATRRPLSEEALMTEETSISGTLRIDRESGVHTVQLNVEIDWDKDTFGTFNLERLITAQVAKIDRKKLAAELEVARKALNGETE